MPLITPTEQYNDLATSIGISSLYLKREDLHPYGSHKGRSIPVMIEKYLKSGSREFVISSSGNAALAAALYVKELNAKRLSISNIQYPISNIQYPLSLSIFVGNHIAPHKLGKLKALEDENIRVFVKERPLQSATLAGQEGATNLRQSTDDSALLGYEALGRELGLIEGLVAIFIATSSGTTAESLAAYLNKENPKIQIHIVQTSSCHPIADGIETYDGPDEESVADAIVDRTAMRKSRLVPLIKKSGGNAWVATNDDISAAQSLIEKNTGLVLSTNGTLSVVGLMQSVYRGWEIEGAVACIIGGE